MPTRRRTVRRRNPSTLDSSAYTAIFKVFSDTYHLDDKLKDIVVASGVSFDSPELARKLRTGRYRREAS